MFNRASQFHKPPFTVSGLHVFRHKPQNGRQCLNTLQSTIYANHEANFRNFRALFAFSGRFWPVFRVLGSLGSPPKPQNEKIGRKTGIFQENRRDGGLIRSTGPFRVFLLKISILGLIGAKIEGNGCRTQKRGLPKRGRDRVCSPAFRLGSKTHAEACTTCEEDGGLGLEAWRDLGGYKMVKNGQKQAKKPKIGLIFPVFMQISCFPAKKSAHFRVFVEFRGLSHFRSGG